MINLFIKYLIMDTHRNYANLEYAIGFGNHVETEALKGAIPKG